MNASPEVAAALEPVVAALGMEIDDVVLSRHGKQRTLEIILDSDSGIDLDAISAASRAISEFLDNSNVMGDGAYTLEVASRGVGTPLTKPAHWRRNVGRLVKISGEAAPVVGRIVSFDDPSVTVSVDSLEKVFDTREISRATIEVEFSRKDGH